MIVSVRDLRVGSELGFTLGMIVFGGKMAGGGGLLQFRAGRLDEIEDGLEKSRLVAQRMATDDDAGAAMPFAAMIEGELDLGPDLKRPLGEEADAFGGPMDLFLNQID
jgi:hypothetical protein